MGGGGRERRLGGRRPGVGELAREERAASEATSGRLLLVIMLAVYSRSVATSRRFFAPAPHLNILREFIGLGDGNWSTRVEIVLAGEVGTQSWGG